MKTERNVFTIDHITAIRLAEPQSAGSMLSSLSKKYFNHLNCTTQLLIIDINVALRGAS